MFVLLSRTNIKKLFKSLTDRACDLLKSGFFLYMEIWKDVPNYEDYYQVSNLGNVKSLERKVKHWRGGVRIINERILKSGIDSGGYNNVRLSKERIFKTFKVHKLVAMAFLDHKPCGMKIVVDHIDNDKSNNKLSNLQLITQRENLSKDKKGSSKHTGVSWDKHFKKWSSKIRVNGKLIHLGTFICELEAAEAYQEELKKINI